MEGWKEDSRIKTARSLREGEGKKREGRWLTSDSRRTRSPSSGEKTHMHM